MAERRPTIADVASRVGVSKSLVSFAFNDRPGVAPQTRDRILATAREMGWRPRPSARSLSIKRSFALGLVVRRDPSVISGDSFFPAFISGVETVLADEGQVLVLSMVPDAATEVRAYRTLAEDHRVDGVFLTDLRRDDSRLALLTELGLPAVTLGRPESESPFPAITLADQPGVHQTVEHLRMLGHRRIGYVAGDVTMLHGLRRRESFVAAMREAGLSDRADRGHRLLRRRRPHRRPSACWSGVRDRPRSSTPVTRWPWPASASRRPWVCGHPKTSRSPASTGPTSPATSSPPSPPWCPIPWPGAARRPARSCTSSPTVTPTTSNSPQPGCGSPSPRPRPQRPNPPHPTPYPRRHLDPNEENHRAPSHPESSGACRHHHRDPVARRVRRRRRGTEFRHQLRSGQGADHDLVLQQRAGGRLGQGHGLQLGTPPTPISRSRARRSPPARAARRSSARPSPPARPRAWSSTPRLRPWASSSAKAAW